VKVLPIRDISLRIGTILPGRIFATFYNLHFRSFYVMYYVYLIYIYLLVYSLGQLTQFSYAVVDALSTAIERSEREKSTQIEYDTIESQVNGDRVERLEARCGS
jgi:hypothetical protein